MRKLPITLLIFTVVLINSVYIAAAQQKMLVEMTISKNDIVEEKVQLDFVANESYDTLAFTTINEPLGILYDGNYAIRQEDNYYVIEFEKRINAGKNSINFTVIYNDLIEQNGNQRILRTSFYPSSKSDLTIELSLPMHFVLSEKEPNVIPKPTSIASDGQKIKLIWNYPNVDYVDISVFYKAETDYRFIVIISILSFIIILLVFSFFYKKNVRKHIDEMLSSEEQKVIEQIRNGIIKQKEIAQTLEFSKSKMSKIVRKLEEKGLIVRTPYFKTNILKLKNKIK